MEGRKFPLPFDSSGDGVSDDVYDDSFFNSMFSGVSLQSFLTLNQNPNLYSSLFGIFPDINNPSSFYPPMNGTFLSENTASSSSEAMKIPKPEPEPMNLYELTELPSFLGDSPLSLSSSFPHLPDLRSLEHPSTTSLPPLMSGFNKRPRVDSVMNIPYNVKPSPEIQVPRSALARQRRQKLSDKTRCLQKLLPWDKKMDIATMLEEAYKYVKFLEAQVSSLQSMPDESVIIGNNNMVHYNLGSDIGGLERLNRNQLLRVLVNSPVAQTMLCSQNCCVFSAEQLGFIQKIVEKKVLLQQMSLSSAFYPKP